MEKLWIFYALGWFLALWLWDFIKKMVVSKGWNKEVFLILSFILYIIIFGINVLINWNYQFESNLLQSALIIWILDFCISLWMLTALKYLEVSFAFISIRLVTSFLILFIWIYILWDILNIYNIIWFALWIIAIFLLSWFNFFERHKIHKKWLLAMIITIISITLSNSYFKYIVWSINIDNFMLIKTFVSFLCIILYMTVRKKFNNFNKIQIQKIAPYLIITSLLSVTFYLIFLPNMYLLWPLSLWYKILSYSLIIPLILSIIIFKEKVNTVKIIAFILTFISIFLFII